jgi:hypothetical protein
MGIWHHIDGCRAAQIDGPHVLHVLILLLDQAIAADFKENLWKSQIIFECIK